MLAASPPDRIYPLYERVGEMAVWPYRQGRREFEHSHHHQRKKRRRRRRRECGRKDQATGAICQENSGRIRNIGPEEHDESHMTEACEVLVCHIGGIVGLVDCAREKKQSARSG